MQTAQTGCYILRDQVSAETEGHKMNIFPTMQKGIVGIKLHEQELTVILTVLRRYSEMAYDPDVVVDNFIKRSEKVLTQIMVKGFLDEPPKDV